MDNNSSNILLSGAQAAWASVRRFDGSLIFSLILFTLFSLLLTVGIFSGLFLS